MSICRIPTCGLHGGITNEVSWCTEVLKLLVTTVTEEQSNAFYRPCRLLKYVNTGMTIGSLKRNELTKQLV